MHIKNPLNVNFIVVDPVQLCTVIIQEKERVKPNDHLLDYKPAAARSFSLEQKWNQNI